MSEAAGQWRALARAPDDEAARLSLATTLARQGRRRQALGVLDLTRFTGEHARDARFLADVLWRDALGRLERVASVPGFSLPGEAAFTTEGSTVVTWSRYAGALLVLDVETGAVLHHAASGALSRGSGDRWDPFYPAPFAFFALDDHGRRLIRIARELEGAGLSIDGAPVPFFDHHAGPAPVRLRGVTDAHRVILDDAATGRTIVATWPSLEVVSVLPRAALVDAASEVAIVARQEETGTTLVAHPLDGSDPRPAGSVANGSELELAGPGTIIERGPTLAVRWLGGPAAVVLWQLSARRPPGAPSLARDGRGLRLVVRGRPRRFDLDLARGRVAGASRPRFRLCERGIWKHVAWHPHADALFGRGHVVGLDGAPLREVGHAEWATWSPDGLALAVSRAGNLDLWRVPG